MFCTENVAFLVDDGEGVVYNGVTDTGSQVDPGIAEMALLDGHADSNQRTVLIHPCRRAMVARAARAVSLLISHLNELLDKDLPQEQLLGACNASLAT